MYRLLGGLSFLLVALFQDTKPVAATAYKVYTVLHQCSDVHQVVEKKIILYSALAAACLACNKESFVNFINIHPIAFLATSFLVSNYLTSVYLDYLQISHILKFLKSVKKLSLYVFALHAVRSVMELHCSFDGSWCKDRDFNEIVFAKTGQLLAQLDDMIIQLLVSGFQDLSELGYGINLYDIIQNLPTLFEKEITVHQILLFCHDDLVLSKFLKDFNVNPAKEYWDVLAYLCNGLNNVLSAV